MNDTLQRIQQLFSEGSALLHSGRHSEAHLCFQTAIYLSEPNATLYLYNGVALHALKRYEEAIASYTDAININSNTGEAYNNLGNSLMALGRFAEAADSFLKASQILVSSPVPVVARATALQALGNVAEAEAECHKALAIAPNFATAHWNLALNLLLQGRYHEGWQEYEWRWLKPDFTSPCRHVSMPLWDGSPLNGKKILLHAEQGFGDAIQFVRYAALVAARGGTVFIECHPELVELLRYSNGVSGAFAFGSELPGFSCHLPLLSLPRIFNTTLKNIPAQCPYISAPVEQKKKWQALLANYKTGIKIGLVWAGKSYPDPLRTCHLADMAQFTKISDATFFSIQLGIGSEEINSTPFPPLIDLTANIKNFSDTAALIEQLDLVVSIDTAVAHLAGALGKPVFLMLPFAADWRWLVGRDDSPWYPLTVIFRQNSNQGWSEVVQRVYAAVASFESKKSFEIVSKD